MGDAVEDRLGHLTKDVECADLMGHFAEDRALDKSTSDGENIGTTGRGIGPCYRDTSDAGAAETAATARQIINTRQRIMGAVLGARGGAIRNGFSRGKGR